MRLPLLLALSAACTAPAARELPVDHPAIPATVAAAPRTPVDPFAATTTFAVPSPRAGATPHAGHGGEPAHALYTCPMHPEVEAAGPGSCPVCGMQLVPRPARDGGSGGR